MSELQNKAGELGGKVKEVAGGAVGNDNLANQGKGEQATLKVKQGTGDLKSKATEALDKLTDKQSA